MITPKYITKKEKKDRIRQTIRKKINGVTEKPRMIIVKSNKYLYTQVVDDTCGHVLASASTLEKALRTQLKSANNKDAAKLLGETIAARLQEKNIANVVFDRNVYQYTGCVKVFADAAREKGIQF